MKSLLILLLLLGTGLHAAEAEARVSDLEAHDQRLVLMAAAVAPLPILHEGRIKPFDTVARHYLMLLTEGQQSIPKTSATPVGLSASAWMLEAMSDREAAYPRPALRIRAYEVADWLGLPRRTPAEVDERTMAWRHSLEELHGPLNANWDRIQELSRKDRKQLGRVEAQMLELVHAVTGFLDASSSEMRLIPGPPDARQQWQTPGMVVQARSEDELQRAVLRQWLDLLTGAAEDDPEKVQSTAAAIAEATAPLVGSKRLDTEVWFNGSNLFADSMVCYILALVLVLVGLAVAPKFLTISGLSLLGLGLIIHTVGIAIRIYIMERPPVATLYESVIFVGWVGVLVCVLIELFRRRKGLATFVGATLGIVLHLVGLGYADDGDTMGMLQAVLNTRFWLTTHVLTIAIGYGLCLVTGLLAHVHLASVIVQPRRQAQHGELARITVGLALISLFFTLFGTILGGIWADQSWGRFWGWDPKENGALLIVLWLLLFLHARLVGLCALGFASSMIVLNVVVAVAWFGVNLLGIGLHSYGFTDGVAYNLYLFAGIECVLAAVLYGLARWRLQAVGIRCQASPLPDVQNH